MPEQGQLDSPFKPCYPQPSETANDDSGSFYGPNMPGAVQGVAPTPATATGTPVQFGRGGSQPGPIDSPFTTATPVDGSSGGEAHANTPMDSPFTTKPPMS